MTTPNYRLHSSEEFRSEAKRPGGSVLCVRKEGTGDVAPADGERLDFIISTETPDRSGDIVRAAGWKLESYRKNPVVLWAHDYSTPPVGRAPTVYAEGTKVLAKGVEFTPRDVNPFGHMVGEMFRKGFMSAVSVGFRPHKWAWLEGDGAGVEYIEHELLEFSAVPVPANPEALVGAKAAGIDVTLYRAWLEKALDGEGGLYLPRAELETVRKLLAPKQVQSAGVPVERIETLERQVEQLTSIVDVLAAEREKALADAVSKALGAVITQEISAAFGGST